MQVSSHGVTFVLCQVDSEQGQIISLSQLFAGLTCHQNQLLPSFPSSLEILVYLPDLNL